MSTQTGAEDGLDRRTATVGRAHPHLEIKVVDDAFPMTVTGKIRKVEMREQSVRELGLESAAAVRNA